jgi:hypothetical protein
LKALALGKRDSQALQGWRMHEIGARLLACVDDAGRIEVAGNA